MLKIYELSVLRVRKCFWNAPSALNSNFWYQYQRYAWICTWYVVYTSVSISHRIDLIHKSQNRNVHISVLNGALWDMKQVRSGICEIGLLIFSYFPGHHSRYNIFPFQYVLLQFITMDIEDSEGCAYDRLVLHDGYDDTASFITYCGTALVSQRRTSHCSDVILASWRLSPLWLFVPQLVRFNNREKNKALVLCKGIHWWPEYSPDKEVMRNAVNDVIITEPFSHFCAEKSPGRCSFECA